MQRRSFLKLVGTTATGALLAGGSAIAYANYIEPGWIEIVQQSLHLPRLDAAFGGYRLIQISDLHADDTWHGSVWIDRTRVAELVQLINEQNADAVVITGDFVTRIKKRTPDTLSPLRELRTRDGVYAILGNHDHWSGPQAVRKLISQYGIHDLSDTSHTLRRGTAQFHLVGMDDLWPEYGPVAPVWSHQARLRRILRNVPTEGAAILLVHEPDFAEVAAATGRFDLQLSGHTHGGQVQLPFYGVLRVPPLGERYPAGLYHVRSMHHYTNRGIGMVEPHVRFDCRPEITVFNFLSHSQAPQAG
ncbi:MAG TPA: metallophosphoesterase [Ktedonobacteraceae bacterium]|jgi:predicted MPP superfamily phosphohydrolase|nr:metallophosphoesterase [Ktedonobacteraceae bacterium]